MLVQQLFPDKIICLEADPELMKGELLPEESKIVEGAINWRVREFRAGRILVREALLQKGIHGFPLINDDNRVPVWPKGIIGSITHTKNYCAVAIGSSKEFKGIGVDAEIISRVKPELWDKICTPIELNALNQCDNETAKINSALIFSAKESFYKCQYALTKTFIGFHDVEIAINLNDEIFTVTLKKDVGRYLRIGQQFAGNFLIRDNLLVTGLLIRSQSVNR